jgi:dGTPase
MVGDLVRVSSGRAQISMSSAVFEAMKATRDFLFERVYIGRVGAETKQAVEQILGTLLSHHAERSAGGGADPKTQAVDYVAGMTDRFALRAFQDLTGAPPPWVGAGALG